MSAYALADLDPPPGKSPVSLAQNESLRRPSPNAIAAAAAVLNDGALYPDPDWHDLRAALGKVHRVDPAHILCGNGSLDLIGCIARVYAGPQRAVLVPAHAYPFFRIAGQMAGARVDAAPEDGITVDVDALLAAVRPDTGLVFVASPGNPTGTRSRRADLLRLRSGLRDDVLLVMDEAYGEFADGIDPPLFDMVAGGNSVVLRTFSKAYGMAGFRVGWGVFPPAIAAELRKVLNPNNISAASQAAAVAALSDLAHMRETCALTMQLRDRARDRLRQAGLVVPDSFTNFLLIDFGSADRARAADVALRAEGVFLRGQAGAGLPGMLRMTIGPAEAVDAAIHHLLAWTEDTTP